jgi:Xaa-Pro aminopeptidase
MLNSIESAKTLKEKLQTHGHGLIPISDNLVDLVWNHKPAIPNEPITVLSIEYTGKSHEEKIKEIQKQIEEKNVHALVVSALDEIACNG